VSATLVSLTAGVVFGIALAAPPGPMNAIIAEESVLRGWTAGFKAGVGAMLADILFFLLVFAGVATLVDSITGLETVLYLLGGLLMLVFALDAWRGARDAAFTDGDDGDARGFQKAFALSITNPYQIGFWLTVGVGLVQPGTLDVFAHLPALGDALTGTFLVETGSLALLVGFFGGIAAWVVIYPAALVQAGRRVDAFAPFVALLSGIVLAGFGLFFLLMGLIGL